MLMTFANVRMMVRYGIYRSLCAFECSLDNDLEARGG